MKEKTACNLINGMHKSNNRKLIKELAITRECLNCEEKFESHSKINRLCKLCRKKD